MVDKVVVNLQTGITTVVPLTQAELDQKAINEQEFAIEQTARNAEVTRLATYTADASRAEIVNHMKNDTLTELATYVRGLVNVDAITGLTVNQQNGLKRVETAIVRLTQALAVAARRSL